MSQKALGRDLGDLLSRARPARLLDRVAGRPGTPEEPPAAAPVQAELPVAGVPSPESAILSAAGDPPGEPAGSPGRPSFLQPPPPPPLADGEPEPRWTPPAIGFAVADGVLLALAAWIAFGPAFDPAWRLPLGIGAAVLACLCGVAAALLHAHPSNPVDRPDSRIRVQLKQ